MRAHHTDPHPAISPEALAALGAPNTVYIRALAPAEVAGLPGIPVGFGEGPDAPTLYGIHAIDGTRVAVLDNREAAFAAARQNDMAPVSVH